MKNLPIYNKIEEILENPGIYIFKVDNNEEHIQKKSQLSKDNMKSITNSIKMCFQKISDDLDKRIQNSEYLYQISSKLKRFGRKFNFPGLQVVNIDREKLNFFSYFPNHFLICEKSDGVRYLLIYFKNGVTILLGRNLEFFQVKLTEQFSYNYKNSYSNWNIVHFLDGELILDDIKNNNNELKGNEIILEGKKKAVNFLVFDAIVIDEKNIGSYPFYERLNCLSRLFQEIKMKRKQIVFKNTYFTKYNKEIKHSFINYDKLTNELIKDLNPTHSFNNKNQLKFSISLFMKDYFTLEQVEIVKNIIPKLPHHNDGIIINTSDYPYYSGQSTEIYKWKPNEQNTIDFEIKYNKKNDIYNLFVSGDNNLISVGQLSFKEDSDDKKKFLSGFNEINVNIAECFYDNTLYDSFTNKVGGWRFNRFRNDKGTPNYIKTYENILVCLKENIHIDDIINIVNQNKNKNDFVNDLKNANDSISNAIWNKFFKVQKDLDFDDDFGYGDVLIEEKKPKKNVNDTKNIIKDKKTPEDKKEELIAKKRKREQEKIEKKLTEEQLKKHKNEEKINNFNETLGLINNTKSNFVTNNNKNEEDDEESLGSFDDGYDD